MKNRIVGIITRDVISSGGILMNYEQAAISIVYEVVGPLAKRRIKREELKEKIEGMQELCTDDGLEKVCNCHHALWEIIELLK